MAKYLASNYNYKLFVDILICLCLQVVVAGTVFSGVTGNNSLSIEEEEERLYLPGGFGPESTAFDWAGRGPYTAIADGRILKYVGRNIGFVNFAYTVRSRPARFCDGKNDTKLARICGRGLGLEFDYKTGKLYVADASYGLMVVSPIGGVAKQLLNSAEGVPFNFFDSLVIDQHTGILYLLDLSSNFNISQIGEAIAASDMSGRLMKYDPKTKKVTVLMRNLGGPAGVTINKDGSYLLFTEYINKRIQKYWLKGPKSNTAEVILNVPGNPDNIKKIIKNYYQADDEFWVALNIQNPEENNNNNVELQGLRINGNGILLETLSFSPQFNTTSLSEVFEINGYLLLGSLYSSYIGVYKYNSS